PDAGGWAARGFALQVVVHYQLIAGRRKDLHDKRLLPGDNIVLNGVLNQQLQAQGRQLVGIISQVDVHIHLQTFPIPGSKQLKIGLDETDLFFDRADPAVIVA
ncbi:MAG TPA: hypothetical protein VN824_07625, partial [Puia sp.]|nr:hypothetical protein [Puia sp.]